MHALEMHQTEPFFLPTPTVILITPWFSFSPEQDVSVAYTYCILFSCKKIFYPFSIHSQRIKVREDIKCTCRSGPFPQFCPMSFWQAVLAEPYLGICIPTAYLSFFSGRGKSSLEMIFITICLLQSFRICAPHPAV